MEGFLVRHFKSLNGIFEWFYVMYQTDLQVIVIMCQNLIK